MAKNNFQIKMVEWQQTWITWWLEVCKDKWIKFNSIEWRRKCSKRRIIVVEWYNVVSHSKKSTIYCVKNTRTNEQPIGYNTPSTMLMELYETFIGMAMKQPNIWKRWVYHFEHMVICINLKRYYMSKKKCRKG